MSLGFTLSEFRRLSLTTGAISGNAGALFPGLPMGTGLWSDGAAFYGGVGSEVVQHTLRGFQRLSFAGEKPSFGLVQGIWGNGSVLYVTDRAKNTIHTITPAPVPTDRSVLVRGDSLEVFESYGSGDLQAGRIHYVPESGTLPFATAVVSRFESGIRASSTTLKGTKAVTAGRIPIRQGGSARTGLSFTNPNSLSTTITFYYTDAAGQDFGRSSFTLGPDQQVLKFADEAPFGVRGFPFTGLPLESARTLTFTSSQPVVVAAVWSQLNERGHFLMAAVPVVEIPARGSRDLYLAPIQHGSGWTSEILLLNATDGSLSGTISFFSQGDSTTPSSPTTVRIRGSSATSFRYAISPRSLERIQIEGMENITQSGFAKLAPDGSIAPYALVHAAVRSAAGILLHETVFEAAHPARSNSLYAESIGVSNEIPGVFQDTTLLITNTSTSMNSLAEATLWQGETSFIRRRLNRIRLLANTQIRITLKELLQGQESVFAGLLRITTESPDTVVTAFRTFRNLRGESLSFAVPVFDDAAFESGPDMVIPLFANGGGYTTDLFLFAPLDLAGTGRFRILSSAGARLFVPLR
ncbi:MAG: hypothetical protein HY646_00065 [Acidobacteria bacterium]|nr:hypothetical protein [Acidobacteriota bacterium]